MRQLASIQLGVPADVIETWNLHAGAKPGPAPGRSPHAVRRIYNIGGEFSRNGKGFLQGPPAVWVEQLTELTLVHGVSGYILCRVESGDIVRRFADEVVPAIRNAVRTERGRQGMSAHADRGVDRLRPRQPSRNRGIR